VAEGGRRDAAAPANMISVAAAGGRDFTVEVMGAGGVDGGRSHRFRVHVDGAVLAALGMGDADEAGLSRLVRESFLFLLAREPASQILARFDLSVIGRYFPDYLSEISARMG
jgi:hypothetical protein